MVDQTVDGLAVERAHAAIRTTERDQMTKAGLHAPAMMVGMGATEVVVVLLCQLAKRQRIAVIDARSVVEQVGRLAGGEDDVGDVVALQIEVDLFRDKRCDWMEQFEDFVEHVGGDIEGFFPDRFVWFVRFNKLYVP